MTDYGYALSSEEHAPNDLIRYAQRAEQAGFSFALISDHYHPWTDRQGQAPFAWSVLGAVAYETKQLQVGTGVTCPLMRVHPAIVAQAAATVAAMMPGRFFLGVGTGEYLNEHIVGEHWPTTDTRQDMLAEAVDIIRALWSGRLVDYDGEYYTVEHARIYTLPDEPPPLYIAASGPESAALAGEIGDGLISVAPKEGLTNEFDEAGGSGKPKFAQVTVCWAPDEAQARRTAREYWPNIAAPGDLSTELALPRHFEQVAQLVSEDDVAKLVPCGPDPEKHLEMARKFERAGFDHIYFHQVGPDQEGFFRFWENEMRPRLGATGMAAG